MEKTFKPNKKTGKFEFTKEQLENLLNEVWRDGYNSNKNYTWHSPYWTYPYYYAYVNTGTDTITWSTVDTSTATTAVTDDNITLTANNVKLNIGE